MKTSPYTGWPKKTEQPIQSIFQDFALINSYLFSHCWIEHHFLIIIIFGWELFILWVISYGLSFLGFARFPEFRGTINDKFMANPENDSPSEIIHKIKKVLNQIWWSWCYYNEEKMLYPARWKGTTVLKKSLKIECSVFWGHPVYTAAVSFFIQFGSNQPWELRKKGPSLISFLIQFYLVFLPQITIK